MPKVLSHSQLPAASVCRREVLALRVESQMQMYRSSITVRFGFVKNLVSHQYLRSVLRGGQKEQHKIRTLWLNCVFSWFPLGRVSISFSHFFPGGAGQILASVDDVWSSQTSACFSLLRALVLKLPPPWPGTCLLALLLILPKNVCLRNATII